MTDHAKEERRNKTPLARGLSVLMAALCFTLMTVLLVRAADSDGDGMTDGYEMFFGINTTNPAGPHLLTNVADGDLDYDSDTLLNSNEYHASVYEWSDPYTVDTDRDGFDDGEDSNRVSRVFLDWGEMIWTDGDNYVYTAPQWWISASREGGEWQTNPPTAWNVPASSNGTSILLIHVDRTVITTNAVLKLDYFDHPNAALYVDLVDTDSVEVVTNVWNGSLNTGSDQRMLITGAIPFVSYPDAVGIRLRRVSGDATVYESVLYIDADLDGLDAEQETQMGSSDNDTDSDNDGLLDYEEVFVYGTDPNDVDTDSDFMSDNVEIAHGNNPTNYDDYASLPFTEGFETATVGTGDINGSNGWIVSVSDMAVAQTSVVYAGNQALQIKGTSTPVTVRHFFGAQGYGEVWSDFFAQPVRRYSEDQVSLSNTISAAFFVNEDGRLVAYDGSLSSNNWVTLTGHNPIADSTWVRLTVSQDFETQKWGLWLNSVNVATNLGFANPVTEYSIFEVAGPREQSGYLDAVAMSASEPAGLDNDGDGMPNSWENTYGLDPDDPADASLDPDNDGLTSLEEYQEGKGTDPTLADTDSDGMGDGAEIAHGNDPASSNVYASLPFAEGFETNTVGTGDINGSNGWIVSVSDMAIAQTSVVYAGNQALEIKGSTSAVVTVTHFFGAISEDVVWSDLRAQPVPRGTSANPADPGDGESAVFYVDEDGRLIVYDGSLSSNNWVTLTGHSPIATSTWVRLTVRQDFSEQTWSLWLDGSNVASDLGFAASMVEYSICRILGSAVKSTYVDDLNMTDGAPSGLTGGTDTDSDGMPDWYEVDKGFDPASASDASGDRDGDGLTNLEEYQNGADPDLLDTDEDGLSDWYEVYVSETDPASSDSDGDTLNDAWEVRYGMDPNSADEPNADADGDGLTNKEEEQAGTNPDLADSDGDGVSDDDEVNADPPTDPLVALEGKDAGAPDLTIESPEQGALILW